MKKQIQELLERTRNVQVGICASALPTQIRTRDIQEAEALDLVWVDRAGKTRRTWIVTCTPFGRAKYAEVMKAERNARNAKRLADLKALGPCPLCGEIAMSTADSARIGCSNNRCDLGGFLIPLRAWVALSKKVVDLSTSYRNF